MMPKKKGPWRKNDGKTCVEKDANTGHLTPDLTCEEI